MPQPLGRDRLEPSTDGTLVLLSFRPKPWRSREETSAEGPALAGTAVRWEGELYELLRVEEREAGGFRHVLAPWDERLLVRSYAEYSGEEAPPEEPALEAAAPSVAAPRGRVTWWTRLPQPVRDLAPGFLAAVALGWFFPFRIMGEGISFLVHELGHTVTAWLFGCTALPAVVMTIAFEQVTAAAVLIWGGIVYVAIRWRHVPRRNVALGAAALVYPFLAFTNAYLACFDLGGHLAELLFAAWALRRAMSGERPEWERHVYSFFAFYLAARNVKLFAGVALSSSARTDYLTIAITGENDLVKLAARTGLSLETLAALTAVLFVAGTAAALLPRLLSSSSSAGTRARRGRSTP